MKDKDTRLIWEALDRDRGDRDQLADWIVNKAKGYADGGMDDETRDDFHTEIEAYINENDVDPLPVIKYLTFMMSSPFHRSAVGLHDNDFVISEVQKAIKWLEEFRSPHPGGIEQYRDDPDFQSRRRDVQ